MGLKLIKSKNVSSNSGKIHKVFTLFGIRFKFFLGFENTLYVNKYLQDIKPYKTSSHKIWEVPASQRSEILKLDWNEASLPPSPKVKERLLTLLKENDFLHLYPKTYNKTILELLSKYTGLAIKNLQYFSSSDAIHEYIAKTYIKENDRVLIQGPSYDNFRLTAQANGGKIYYSEVDESFRLDKEKFRQDVKTVQPKFVYICSPNNPCGFTNSPQYIESLLKEFPGIMFLIDEAYFEFCTITAQNLVLKYENILITRTLSKAFACANLRFGYLMASANNILSISSIRNPKNMNTFTQEAAIAILSDIDYMKNYVKEVLFAKEYFYKEIRQFRSITTYPSSSNFVLLQFENYGLKIRFKHFLEKHNIFIRDLVQSPLLYKCLRITIGNHKQMQCVIDVIKKFFRVEKMPHKTIKNKIALFDFCETLTNFQTGNAYVYYAIEHKDSWFLDIKYSIRKKLDKLHRKIHRAYSNKRPLLRLLKGLTYAELDKLAFNYYVEQVRPNLMPQVLKEMQELKNKGYRIYLVSGGYGIYLKYFVEEFQLDGYLATELKFHKNRFTGEFDGLDCMHANKITLLKQYFKQEPLEDYDTIFYTDSETDLPLLKFCKEGVVIIQRPGITWSQKYPYRKIIIEH